MRNGWYGTSFRVPSKLGGFGRLRKTLIFIFKPIDPHGAVNRLCAEGIGSPPRSVDAY